MTSLSCKKFKRIFTLKRGHEGQLICIQKNIKSAAIYEKGQFRGWDYYEGGRRGVEKICGYLKTKKIVNEKQK